MILYAPGDVWAWNVAVRYADASGVLLDDRERWTVRVEKGGDLAVERRFLGTMMDDGALVPSADPRPETLKGRVEPDGTLSLKDSASDPVAARVLRRLLNPDRSLTERLAGTSLVRHAVIREAKAFLPGSGLPASLRIEATLVMVRLGGKDIPLSPPGERGQGVRGNVIASRLDFSEQAFGVGRWIIVCLALDRFFGPLTPTPLPRRGEGH